MATTLQTKIGRKIGSAESRRLVATDHIPGVIYGHGMVPVKITVDRRDLRVALAGPAGVNTILELHVGDAKYPAIVKELQRDPVKRVVRHIDFMQISLTELITMDIPVHLTGTAKAVLSEGGLVDATVNTIQVRATAANIPNEILIDVTAMEMQDVIRLSDVVLPNGVSAVGDPDLVVVTVLETKIEEVAPVVAAAVEGAAAAVATPEAGAAPAGDAKPSA
ncbi:50S ribosomal protein L25 [Acidimicrobiaceae bacterium]|nr:50S ribosomal protein L25 [Acidimicrobiaceae bacterium]